MLIVVGTVLFIAYFLPFSVQKSKQNKKIFYTKAKIMTVSDFIYRTRSNARTLIMLTLLSAATLTVSSVMALSLFYPIAAVARIASSELEFWIEEEGQLNNAKLLVSQYAHDDSVTYIQTDIYKVNASAEKLPMEYSVGTSKGSADNENILREAGFECISYSQYISLLQAQGRNDIAGKLLVLQDNKCIFVMYHPNADGNDETWSIYSLNINDGSIPLTVKATTLNNPISFANSIGTMILNDNVYEQIKSDTVLENSIVSINGEGIEDNENLFEDMSNLLSNKSIFTGTFP